eukprot:gnl/TRDRNA2_/TRDRNA2_108148_c0_seq1.p1 gnl/TRDRNA2_/TRDRNA2_108148_c0~~gnl/TRDRNA2_/TRDRNA2_108148_c0_seq1.p1  ORF type:complete len:690 (-),score=152.31 gnl/TRDRNA2_/TRDRNA2_108148_c0_seq1:96-2090(-)
MDPNVLAAQQGGIPANLGLDDPTIAAMQAQQDNLALFHAGQAQALEAELQTSTPLVAGVPGLQPRPPLLGLPANIQLGGLPQPQANPGLAAMLAQAQQQNNAVAALLGQQLPPPGLPGATPTPGLAQPVTLVAAPVAGATAGIPGLQAQQDNLALFHAGQAQAAGATQPQKLASIAEFQASQKAAKEKAANEQKEAMNRARQQKEEKAKEEAAQKAEMQNKRCHLHKKPKAGCKFCKRLEDFVDQKNQENQAKDAAAKAALASSLAKPVEITNSKTFGFTPLLQTHIIESAHFKSLLPMDTLEQIEAEMLQFADTIEPYLQNSSTSPSCLFCCLYRLFTMGVDSRAIKGLIDNTSSPYIRCLGFLYIRFGVGADQLWTWIGEYVLDDEELRPQKDSEWKTSVGEFVESLLSQDKYYSTILPRLPMGVKRQLEAKLAPVEQYRKRTRANLDLLDIYREDGVRVEVVINGEWRPGQTLELLDDAPSRVKVRVRLDDETEEVIHIGMVILTDRRFEGVGGAGRTRRDRSRSRSPGGSKVDWARQKGRSDTDLVNEMRSKDREKAVCSSGKEYARKPLGYKAACALPREQGAASHRLMEEETFVPMKQTRRRSPSPSEKQQFGTKAPSIEHQARMQQLFEKYGMNKGAESASGAARSDLDQNDVLRFG